jgi:hypothetical protein
MDSLKLELMRSPLGKGLEKIRKMEPISPFRAHIKKSDFKSWSPENIKQWGKNLSFSTRKIPGDDRSPRSWRIRVQSPLKILIPDEPELKIRVRDEPVAKIMKRDKLELKRLIQDEPVLKSENKPAQAIHIHEESAPKIHIRKQPEIKNWICEEPALKIRIPNSGPNSCGKIDSVVESTTLDKLRNSFRVNRTKRKLNVLLYEDRVFEPIDLNVDLCDPLDDRATKIFKNDIEVPASITEE